MNTNEKLLPVNAKLGVYIIDKNCNLVSVINSTCELYKSTNPMIRIVDKMIKNILNTEILYFYNPASIHFDFFCDDLMSISDISKPVTSTITIEVMQTENEYIILSPGLWVGLENNRHRLCDDYKLYNLINFIPEESRMNIDDFCREFFNIYNKLNTPQQIPVDKPESSTSEETPVIEVAEEIEEVAATPDGESSPSEAE